MPEQWYLHIQGETIGPIPGETVAALLRCSRLMPSDLLWSSGMTAWERAGNMRAFASYMPSEPSVPMPTPPPPESSLPVKAFDRALAEAVEIREAVSPAGEQRKFWILRMVRVRINAMAQIEKYGSFAVHDLSESGVFLITSSPLPVGTQVTLNLESSELARSLQLAGTVVRIGRSSGGQTGFAIRLEGIAASERLLIQELVKAKHVKTSIL